MKKYNLTNEQEEIFNDLVIEMKDKINLALYKCNINKKNYSDFYSYALEDLLVAFLIAIEEKIPKEQFYKFSYVTMKRKIIDEIRRRNKEKYILMEKNEDLKLFKDNSSFSTVINFKESIKTILSKEEIVFLKHYENKFDINDSIKELKISKSKAYKVLANIKKKSYNLLNS